MVFQTSKLGKATGYTMRVCIFFANPNG